MGGLWKSSEDDSLVFTLCNTFETGQQAESGWKLQVWTAVIKGFGDAGLPTKTIKHCDMVLGWSEFWHIERQHDCCMSSRENSKKDCSTFLLGIWLLG